MIDTIRRCARRCRLQLAGVAALACLLGPAQAAGAGDEPSLRQYLRQNWQTAEGLPQNSVRAIVQTREGYLWFGTAEGLVRFDGVRFTVYDRTSSPALPNSNVDSLAVASDGALWVGLRRYGLLRLKDGQFSIWNKSQGLSASEMVSLAATADGSIWAGTIGQGLNRIKDGRVTVYRKEQGLPSNDVTVLTTSNRGGLLVGTNAGIVSIADNGTISTVVSGDGDPQSVVNAILETKSGAIWYGTAKGAVRLEGGTATTFTAADGLPANDVTTLSEGRDGAIWMGFRSGGLARLRNGHLESFTASDGLPDDFVRAVYEDHEHNIWVGTNAGGVSRLHDTPFLTISKREGLPTDVTRAVFESQDGSMWVGTPAHGLIRIHDDRVTRWTTAEGLPVDGIAMIGQSRDGAMWIGTRSGLVRMIGDTLTRYTTKDGLPHDNARAFFEDREGTVWISTASGVCRMEGERCNAIAGLKIYARGFHQAADGTIWIASNRGLYRYDHGTITHWGEHEGLSSEFLTSLAAESDGTLWLSTSSAGLNRFKDGRITSYGTAQGLAEQTLFRVLSDRLGWVWMTSNHGLFRVPRAELDAVADGRARTVHPQSYTEVDGLPSPEFNGGSSPAGIVARNGHLWFPSAKGVVVVDPARVEGTPPSPVAYIERAIMDGRPVDPSAPATVGPSEGNLEFQYTAFQFVAPSRLRFRYKLEGFDTDWVDAGARRTAYYTRIPPGQYVFRVESSNEAGTWGYAGTTAAITLKPRFYQTSFFLGSCWVVALFALVAVVNLRTARHRKQERRLAEMVDARTRELQEEVAERRRAEAALVEAREAALEASRLKSEFLANMSHEIRTPMNGIIGMTDLALEHELPGEVKEYLQIVDSSANALLHVINDILDFAKIEAGRLDMVALDFDLRGLLNTLSTLLGPQANQKGLTLRCDVSADIPPRLIGDPLRLRQVLTNLIGNALKFTDHGEVRVEVTRIDSTPRQAGLRFAIVDTGIGIADADRARIFEAFTQVDGSASRRFGGTGLGLAISAQLVKLMGGSLYVESAVGKGSCFAFELTFGVAEAPVVAPTIPAYARATRSLAVLVAEDSPVNQLLVRRLLERAGHSVTVVETGTAAIDAVKRTQFDAIFMDVQMPEMNGIDATSRIRAIERDGRPRVPIIALTAHAMRGDRERCIAAGMDGYVSKPIRPELLFASLAEATGSRDAA